jgi:LCP family protein required for cell wall assembly
MGESAPEGPPPCEPVKRRKRHILRWTSLGVVLVVIAAGLVAYMKYRSVYDSIHRVALSDLGQQPPDFSTSSMNILVFGSDSRAGLDAHLQHLLDTGDDQGNNTDTIMIVHISPGRHEITVMSIPRDTMVPMYQCNAGPGYPGQQADPGNDVIINSLLSAGGPSCLFKTVEQQTGIHLDHFVEMGMLGFVKVINDLGGVNVCVPFDVNDPMSGLNLAEGEHHINGVQALAFWRTREDLGTGSDLERIQRDQFMSAQVVKGIMASNLLSDPLKLLQVISDAAASMTTDNSLNLSAMLGIAESFRHLPASHVQFITAPNQPWSGDPTARVQFEQPQADAVFSAIAHDVTVPKAVKVSTAPPPVLDASPSQVKVEVLNGSGVAGIATATSDALAARGFDVMGASDAANFGYARSVIIYETPAEMPEVNTLKKQLTDVTTQEDTGLAPGTLELILGSDFTALVPDPSASPSPSSSPSSAVSPSPSASPSSASQIDSLAQADGGITASASCTSDAQAFSGPLSP